MQVQLRYMAVNKNTAMINYGDRNKIASRGIMTVTSFHLTELEFQYFVHSNLIINIFIF